MGSEIGTAARAGGMTWWLNAALAGTVPLDVAVGHLPGSVVAGDALQRDSWPIALGRLRAQSTSVRLVIVEPGDPLGLPGPAAVTELAVQAGLAIIGHEHVLVPVDGTDVWRAMPAQPSPVAEGALGTLAEAARELREAMIALTIGFECLDPDDDTLASLQAMRRLTPPTPPPGLPPKAASVAGDALRVWWTSMIAHDLARRSGRSLAPELAHLRPTARRAASVAFSEPVSPAGGRTVRTSASVRTRSTWEA